MAMEEVREEEEQDLVDVVIGEGLEGMRNLEVGSSNYKTAAEAIQKLYEMKADEWKKTSDVALRERELDLEEAKNNQQIRELELETSKVEHQKRNDFIRNIIEGGKALGLCLVSVWGTIYVTHKEDIGTYVTTAGKSFTRSVTDLFKKM